ncbi:MAG TPA: protein-L-isoaspartate O-methyltransferase [Methylomirabilota bacterium]|nr:protein-L-isoaspartate O-methyltransferase [Methylomirabilota bacterium]
MADMTALRTKMVDGQIRPSDVTDHRIIDAMLAIPREAFVPAGLTGLAYLDRNLPVSADGRSRCLIQPMVLARMVQAAEVGPDDVVLEIGCASGYGAALLARLASSVVALEEDESLADMAAGALSGLGVDNVTVVKGPLAAGYPDEGPYDVIFVNGAVEVAPEALAGQLKQGGRMVLVVGVGQAARGMLYTRSGAGVSGRVIMNASVPLLPGFARIPAFEF